MKNKQLILIFLTTIILLFSFCVPAFAEENIIIDGQCPYCGSATHFVTTSHDFNTCQECGQVIERCKECGTFIKEGSVYCASCEKNIKSVRAALVMVSIITFIVVVGAVAGSYPGRERKQRNKQINS